MGIVVTFYSYKGGVGRSFLLANTAAVLAGWGYKVLCVDWDLEAPGLQGFFQDYISAPKAGLVEWAQDHAADKFPDWRDYLTPARLPGGNPNQPLDLLLAGRPDATYVSRLQQLSWDDLFANHKFGTFLEETRAQWLASYDLILVDSRTGISDSGGICTVHLPDVLLLALATNEQNLNGVAQVGRRVVDRRGELPFDRVGLLVLPVVSKLEMNEFELAEDWLGRIADKLGDFYEPWLDAELKPADVLRLTAIPYFTYWAYGESLAVLREARPQASTVSYHVHTIAALLARHLADTQGLAANRDEYVAAARRSGAGGGSAADVFLSSSGDVGDRQYARRLTAALRDLGLAVVTNEEQHPGEGGSDAAASAVGRARHLVILLGQALSPRQGAEVTAGLRRLSEDLLAGNPDPGQVVIILLAPNAPLPRPLSLISGWKRIEANGRTEDQLAEQIAAGFGNFAPLAELDAYYL